MPVDPEAIPVLTRWGLSADADLVYRALTLLGPADGTRLARELGLARTRTRSALDELAAAGATTAAGTVWAARTPAEVVRRFQRRSPAAERWRRLVTAIEGIGTVGPFDVPPRLWPTRSARRSRMERHGPPAGTDGTLALLPADPHDVAAEDKAMAALCALFERHWAQGGEPDSQEVVPIDLSPRESALVDLLALGHTDRSAADELGLSARTVAYTMRALMDRLGVQNRFQLALTLGAAGAARPAGTEPG